MRGLPAPLPEGERVLWQGAPQTRPFLRQIFHTRLVTAYVGLLLGWCLVDGVQAGNLAGAGIACAKFGGLAGGAVAMFAGLAWMMARSTTYTITSARVLIEYGSAMEKTVQIPFSAIDGAALAEHGDGSGDLTLQLVAGQGVNYLLMWPHVRPWHISRPEPALRAVGDCRAVAQVLGRALAASAGTAAVALVDRADARQGAGAAVAA